MCIRDRQFTVPITVQSFHNSLQFTEQITVHTTVHTHFTQNFTKHLNAFHSSCNSTQNSNIWHTNCTVNCEQTVVDSELCVMSCIRNKHKFHSESFVLSTCDYAQVNSPWLLLYASCSDTKSFWVWQPVLGDEKEDVEFDSQFWGDEEGDVDFDSQFWEMRREMLSLTASFWRWEGRCWVWQWHPQFT